MKYTSWYVVIIMVGWLVISAAQDPDHLKTIFRQIGHEWLWTIQDSTTRVSPVENTQTGAYRIAFERSFGFHPDSLTAFFIRRMAHYSIKTPYRVLVKECAHADISYSWEVYGRQEENIIPCLGRPYPEGCYYLEVSLLTSSEAADYPWWQTGIFLIAAGLAAYFWFKRQMNSRSAAGKNLKWIGKFAFDEASNEMYFNGQTVSLTDKEGRLLQLLLRAQGQVVERDQILKEVWNDEEGLLVTRSADVFISRLRKYLRADPNVRLIAVHGLGYKLDVRPAES